MKKIFALLFCAQISWGAIGFDATSNVAAAFTASPVTWTHTNGSNATLLTVCVGFIGTVGTISALTYNSVALTQIKKVTDSNVAISSELWYLKNPATGPNTISITFSPTAGAGSYATAVSLTGTDTTNPLDANNGAQNGPTFTVAGTSVTTVADNTWLVDCLKGNNSVTVTTRSGQTQRVFFNDTTNGTSTGQYTIGPITPSGIQGDIFNLSIGINMDDAAASFLPSSVGIGKYNKIQRFEQLGE